MLLIPLFLSESQQGYWYLFIGLSALSVFADLGFANIILQFSAHEYAFLKFTGEGLLFGPEKYLWRLSSFFRFMIKWIILMCSCVFPVIYIIGYIYFRNDDVVNIYMLPWTFFLIGVLINFFNNVVLYFIEGLNKIEDTQKIRLKVAFINTFVVSITLILKGNIYALIFGTLVSAIVNLLLIIIYFGKLIKQMINITKDEKYNWEKEVKPLFVKYAISFSCGYFISSIYVPLAHYLYGPLFSGKVGISLALTNTIYGISYIWLNSISPTMNIYIARHNWKELDFVFKKRLIFAISTYLIFSIGIGFFMLFFSKYHIFEKIISRFLPMKEMIVLLLSYMLLIPVSAWGLYLRGHKKEPYLVSSIIQAGLVVLATILIGRYLQIRWFFGGYFVSFLCIIPINYKLYRKYKFIWHSTNE
jgi:hypothetical protein